MVLLIGLPVQHDRILGLSPAMGKTGPFDISGKRVHDLDALGCTRWIRKQVSRAFFERSPMPPRSRFRVLRWGVGAAFNWRKIEQSTWQFAIVAMAAAAVMAFAMIDPHFGTIEGFVSRSITV